MAQSCLLEKGTKLHVIIGNPPSNYHEDLFSQFKAECKNQMLLVSGNLTYTSGCWDRHVKKVDTETKIYVILTFAINALIWYNFEKKCLKLVIACRPLKLTTSAARGDGGAWNAKNSADFVAFSENIKLKTGVRAI